MIRRKGDRSETIQQYLKRSGWYQRISDNLWNHDAPGLNRLFPYFTQEATELQRAKDRREATK